MQKKYRRRSRWFRFLGFLVLGVSTLGAFFAYETLIGWENFKQEDMFLVVREESLKLNFMLALPILVGLLVFFLVAMKRNKEFFSDKYSVGIILTLIVLYLVYSVVEVVLFSLVGATIGAILDDYVFKTISDHYKRKYNEEREIDNEYEKEKRRIRARKQAREELDGSV